MKKHVPFFFLLLCGATLYGGAWTLPQGRLWVKTAYYYQKTHSRFCSAQDARSLAFRDIGCTAAGHSVAFDPFIGGESHSQALFTEIAYGLTGWLDVGLQLPIYRLRFVNLSDPNRDPVSSIGDIRFYGKVQLITAPLIVSIRLGAKSPTGKFTVDAEVVNLSEGQWDYELSLDLGRSLWPLPGYVNVAAGYRFRTDNNSFEITIGNEFTLALEGGVNILPAVFVKGSLDWLRSERPRIRTTGDVLLSHRELLSIAPSVMLSPHPSIHIEAGLRHSLAGQNFPDGVQYFGGLSYQIDFLP